MLPRFSTYLLWLCVAAIGAVEVRAQSLPLVGAVQEAGKARDNAAQLIVLKNGEVLQGHVQSSGDRLLVTLPGREISLRRAEVDVIAGTLEEAYTQKRAKTAPTDIAGGLDLAAWCLRHSLYKHAAAELAAVRTRQPRDPRLAQLERRLEREAASAAAKASDLAGRTRTAQQSTRPAKSDSSPAGSELTLKNSKASWPPVRDDAVVQATHAADTPKPTAPEVTVESPAALDRFVRSLPAEAVEQFTGAIQPLIVNGCAAAACHAPGNQTNFTLLRLPPGKLATRRLTQRNLYNTAQLVDFSNAQESKLLAVARQPHGPLKAGVFGDPRSSKYRDLSNWVAMLTRTNTEDDAPGDNPPAIARTSGGRKSGSASRRRQTTPESPESFPGSVQQATFDAPDAKGAAADKRTKRAAHESIDARRLRKENEPAGSGAKDAGTPSASANNRWPPIRDTAPPR